MHLSDHNPAWNPEPNALRNIAVHNLSVDSRPRSFKTRVACLGLLHERLHKLRRNRKSDSIGATRAAHNPRIHANQSAVHINQSATRITRIDRRICLDEIPARRAHCPARARQARHNTRADSLPNAKRVPDRQNQFTNIDSITVTQAEMRHPSRVLKLQKRQVAFLISKNNPRIKFSAVIEHYTNICRLTHHMIV